VGTVPVSVETRTWYNEDLESSAFIIPGVLALVMSVIGAFLTSLTIAREWERGSMEQLVSTPVSAMEIMLGKLIPYFVMGIFDVGVCALLATAWFGVPFRGSVATLAVSSALFLAVVLSQGFLISVLAKNQFAASQIALITTFLPAFLLSGFLFAIEQMPAALQWITRILPARYYVSVLKRIFLKGTPISMLGADLIPLAVFALLLTVIATRAFHKRLE
jgi:ABC-2 type transport system permease protein